MPRVNDRRVAHKSTGGIPPKIPTPVGPVGNAPNHLTPNTVALSASHIWTPPACKGDCSAIRKPKLGLMLDVAEYRPST